MMKKEIKMSNKTYVVDLVPTGDFAPNQYNFWISKYSKDFGGSASAILNFIRGEKDAENIFKSVNKGNIEVILRKMEEIGHGNFADKKLSKVI